jgi:hypothetical protein
MTNFTTVHVFRQHGARARELAQHFDMNAAGFFGTLIDAEYRRVFGIEPDPLPESFPALMGKKLSMKAKNGEAIEILLTDAIEVATMIYEAAKDGTTSIKTTGLSPLVVSRKGRGVIIDGSVNGKTAKITLSSASAIVFATKMKEKFASHLVSQ